MSLSEVNTDICCKAWEASNSLHNIVEKCKICPPFLNEPSLIARSATKIPTHDEYSTLFYWK